MRNGPHSSTNAGIDPMLIYTAPQGTPEWKAALQAAFTLDVLTGIVTRRDTRGGQVAGKGVGRLRADGYLSTKFLGREILLHRLVWALSTGDLPPTELDHINGNRADNRPANLRLSTRSENNQNRRAAHANNRLGVLGVTQSGARFLARIRLDGKLIRLGRFDTAQEAHSAYLAAKRDMHAGCTL
jgi:hypothetical protein